MKASDNEFPQVILEEVANDGSATTTPAADHRSLFLGEDGDLHLKDSAAGVTDVGGAGGGAPWRHELLATNYSAHTNFSTLVAIGGGSGNKLLYLQSSGVQNDEVIYEGLTLDAGTYTVIAWVFKSTNHGIISVQLDTVELTTFDLYNGSAAADQRVTATALSVASSDTYQLKLKMATKNASSSSYFGLIHSITFVRTA